VAPDTRGSAVCRQSVYIYIYIYIYIEQELTDAGPPPPLLLSIGKLTALAPEHWLELSGNSWPQTLDVPLFADSRELSPSIGGSREEPDGESSDSP